MKLKQITLITMIGIAAAFSIYLLNYPWAHLGQNARVVSAFIGNALMYSSLLFFLVNLYRRG